MHYKSGITSWKSPNSDEFVTRKEYSKLAKRAGVCKLTIPNYLISLGYFHDKYNYYRLKDKIVLEHIANDSIIKTT